VKQKILLFSALALYAFSLVCQECTIHNNTNSKVTVTVIYKPTIEKQACVKKMLLVSRQSKKDIDVTQRGCTPYSFVVTASDGSLAGKSAKFVATHPFISTFTINITEGPDSTVSIEVK
jgi:hypothetical protein